LFLAEVCVLTGAVQEHLVQWHPTILSRMAIVDQRVMNAYSKGDGEAAYKDGDLVVRFPGCAEAGPQACETESQAFVQAWRRVIAS
jgi:mannan polymerase II complex MNN11 subunit